MILLDTNVWSVLPKPDANPAVVEWIAQRSDEIWLSVVVIAEIRMGVEGLETSTKRRMLTQWLIDLEIVYAKRIRAFESAEAHIFGSLVARRKLEKQQTKLLDIQLAAQAIASDCPVATRNTRDFEWTGVDLIDPWMA